MADLILLSRVFPNPFQPRLSEDPDHVRKIAESIGQHGLLQNPVGRYVDADGKPVLANAAGVQLAFGHTRLAAFRLLHDQGSLGYGSIPVEIRNLTDQEMFEMTISENLARKDLTPIEEARAMQTYRDRFGKTSDQIGKLFGIGGSAVRNKMRLLDLPEIIQAALGLGTITEGLARALLALYDLPQQWRTIALTSEHNPLKIEQRALAGEITPAGVYEEVEAIRALFSPKMDLSPSPLVGEGAGGEGMRATVSTETPAPAIEITPAPAWQDDDEVGPDGPDNDGPAPDEDDEPESVDSPTPAPRPAPPVSLERKIEKAAAQPVPAPVPSEAANAFAAAMAGRMSAPSPAVGEGQGNGGATPWDQLQIAVTITYLPVDAAGDRPVIVTVKAGEARPVMLFGREHQALLSGLPADMLDEVRHSYELNH